MEEKLPFSADHVFRIGGQAYRVRPTVDMPGIEAYWLTIFAFKWASLADVYDPESVLAWLAERNLLRHLEPEDG